MKKLFLIIFAAVIFNIAALADSSLTSTTFSEAYQTEKIIATASQTNGELTNELLDYLIDARNPIDIKMAVINQLGWQFEGKSNARTFLDYVSKKNKYADRKDFLAKASGDDLLSFAYLSALDDYFNVDQSLEAANAAVKKNPESFTFNVIAALIKAQKEMESDWCLVYKITDSVRKDSSLKKGMKPEAVKIIYDYMDIYGENCN